jgi:hypothetical protein
MASDNCGSICNCCVMVDFACTRCRDRVVSGFAMGAQGASAAAVGILGIFWLIIVQVIASAMGGYLAGRLRTKWAAIHT